jgi:hypothetical protein
MNKVNKKKEKSMNKQPLALKRLSPEKRQEIIEAAQIASRLLTFRNKRTSHLFVTIVSGYTQQPYLKRYQRRFEILQTAQRIAQQTGVDVRQINEDLLFCLSRYWMKDVVFHLPT